MTLTRTRALYFAAGDHTNPVKTLTSSTTTWESPKLQRRDHLGDIRIRDLQRKTAEAVDYGPFILSYGYEYDANGLKKSFTGPDGIKFDYFYDSNNRLSSIVIPGQARPPTIPTSGTVRRDYPSWSSSTAYVYDPLMQAQSIDSRDPARTRS